MSEDPYALKLYIDGNAYNNPGGSGGFACYAEYPEAWQREDAEVFSEGYHETNNNRMELQACIRALEYVRDDVDSRLVPRVQIVTDSMYVHGNQNMPTTWRRNGWKTSSGRPIENPDLWKSFLRVRGALSIRTDIIWRKGKRSTILKNVDRAAKGAGKLPIKNDRGFRQGKIGRSKLVGGSSSLFPAAGQECIIRVYRSSLVGRRGHKVFFDVLNEATGVHEEKCRAYVDAQLINELHRGHSYRVRFNGDSRNPMIAVIINEVSQLLPK